MSSLSSLELWIEKNLGKEIFHPGLERISEYVLPLFQKLKKKGTRFVTIGGTNGKGQTALTLAYLLKVQNISYTLWTSPHILTITERMSSHLGDVKESWLLARCLEDQALSKKLSYFEFLFVEFMKYSLELSPSVVILEVGLGGRFDAVNALDADVMAITSISRDHEEILGVGYAKILREKWGIVRSGKPLFTAFSLSYLQDFAKTWSDEQKILWIDLVELGVIHPDDHFFTRNQLMAFCLLNELMGRGKSDLRNDWKKVKFPPMPHRGDQMNYRGAKLQFIGSHNIDGMRKLIHYFEQRKGESFDFVLLSFSKRPQGEMISMIKSLQASPTFLKKMLVTKFHHPKAWNEDYTKLLPAVDKLEEIKWEDFLSREDLEGKNILVTGSYYFVGAIKNFILSNS